MCFVAVFFKLWATAIRLPNLFVVMTRIYFLNRRKKYDKIENIRAHCTLLKVSIVLRSFYFIYKYTFMYINITTSLQYKLHFIQWLTIKFFEITHIRPLKVLRQHCPTELLAVNGDVLYLHSPVEWPLARCGY